MKSSIIGIAFDCENADALADFYAKLFGWEKELSGGGYAALRVPNGPLLVFQSVEGYVPPVWPWKSGRQQQMAHIDYLVDDLEKAAAEAEAMGAVKSPVQYFDTSTVMFDPAGHPFCLSTVAQ